MSLDIFRPFIRNKSPLRGNLRSRRHTARISYPAGATARAGGIGTHTLHTLLQVFNAGLVIILQQCANLLVLLGAVLSILILLILLIKCFLHKTLQQGKYTTVGLLKMVKN